MDRFEQKLKDWFGEFKSTDTTTREIKLIYEDKEGEEIFAKAYLLKEITRYAGVHTKITIVRVFVIGDRTEISVDLQLDDITKTESLIQLIEYGNKIGKYLE